MISARRPMMAAFCAISFTLASSAAIAVPNANLRPAVRTAGSQWGSHTLTDLYAFSGPDGSSPEGNLDLGISYGTGGLIATVFGTTEGGGANASGTIYRYVLGSNALTSLYSFTGGNDGSTPVEGVANNETAYFGLAQPQLGVANQGGANGQGAVYAIGANGQPTVLHAFTGGADGGTPFGRLTQFVDGNYYGTTTSGGANGYGTVFSITPSGVLTTLYSFTGGADGGSPQAGLAISADLGRGYSDALGVPLSDALQRSAFGQRRNIAPYLYGTTSTGANGYGTIFRIAPTGALQTLYAFTGGLDGGIPAARLTSDLRGNLYGSTTVGGAAGNGVIFALKRNRQFVVLHDFGSGAQGANPSGQLTFGTNGNLYGTTLQGGASGQYGSVFELSRFGFADIHDFTGADGANPQGALLDVGHGTLLGTTTNGGANSAGVLFSIAE